MSPNDSSNLGFHFSSPFCIIKSKANKRPPRSSSLSSQERKEREAGVNYKEHAEELLPRIGKPCMCQPI
ncbi:hypothetical protein KC19_VG096800 [Ceratodon purpureus]|uniref:Uncharacterized protein n=1 Tax=Ceratodon purpureus TaxID=3225 RepID=A0A8T0HNP7_CERPU|nr:hypothetical protein KC19_VG096800 [Ceratodon purpureus]